MNRFRSICSAAVLALSANQVESAEGGFSFYLPGALGDIILALPPEPGLLFANTGYFQSGSAGSAVLQGQVNLDLDLTLAVDVVTVSYTFPETVLGGRYTIGASIPFGYADLSATVGLPGGGTIAASDDAFQIGDIAFVPIQLNWSKGNYSFKFAETIFAPTGGYDVDDVVNLGLNHWGLDTAFAMTYFNPETGREFSIAPGVLINSTNDDTDYRTGTEFHVDFTANQFLSETFAVGIRGYYYNQLSGDSGTGAVLGDFQGEAFGVGPGFVWVPKSGGGNLTILGKWIHDFSSTNRFESDYATITAAWTF
ncbi:MAG: SphA family protein [Boseongicola sp.]